MNLSCVDDNYFDFSRVESIEVDSFTTGACSKIRQNVVMVMFSGHTHTWGEFVNNEHGCMRRRDSLLAAVKKARGS